MLPTDAELEAELNPEQLRAVRGKREIELSPREAKLLAILHENAGKPVSRDTGAAITCSVREASAALSPSSRLWKSTVIPER